MISSSVVRVALQVYTPCRTCRLATRWRQQYALCRALYTPTSRDAVASTAPPNVTIDASRGQTRCALVSVIGTPNAGKSVLTNALVGAKLCGVSNKVHTTRGLETVIKVYEDTQLILQDTPGVVSKVEAKKHSLEKSLLVDPEESLRNADTIVVLVDVSNQHTRDKIDPRILHMLCRHRKRSVLVLTKVDLLKNKLLLLSLMHRLTIGVIAGQVLKTRSRLPKIRVKKSYDDLIDNYVKSGKKATVCDSISTKSPSDAMEGHLSDAMDDIVATPTHELSQDSLKEAFVDEFGWAYFDAVFMVSALNLDGVEELRQYLLDQAPESTWKYEKEVKTLNSPRKLAHEAVRTAFMDHLKQEVPYSIDFKLIDWKEVGETETLFVEYHVICKTDRHATIVVGNGGQMIKAIWETAMQNLANVFQRDVFVKFTVMTEKKQNITFNYPGVK